jgi:enoyl-CoA hydratase/carnithine racemase
MDFETLIVSVDGAKGDLVLNRPDRLNAMNPTMLRELTQAAAWFDSQPDVRVVVIRSEGRAFCAGADLGESALGQESPEDVPWIRRRDYSYLGQRMADAIENMSAVTVARLHGYVVGGAVVLTSACDLRFAGDETVFKIPEVDLGIPLTWGGIPRLVRDIGPVMTKELVMTCRNFDAAEARLIGFVNDVMPTSALDKRIDEFVHELIERPAVPVAVTKAQVNAVNRAMGIGSTAGFDGDLLMGTATDPDSRAAAMAYIERHRSKQG